jgi:4-carboxymuconolactone decarboxylase
MRLNATAALTIFVMVLGLAAAVPAQQTGPSQPILIARSGSQPLRTGPAENFTGIVKVEPVFQAKPPARASGSVVTFEAGARSAWHTHPLGQTLIVTAGIGRVQRWGDPADEIRPGDVVWIPAGQKHWHGAAPDTSMAHLAISEPLDGKSVEWMEKVTDEQYRAPVRGAAAASGTQEQTTNSQDERTQTGMLSAKQERMVAISAFTANGDLLKLRKALNAGLDAGLKINETREILVHLYAYAGFPRSLQGINTLISVLEDRSKRGIRDVVGREASLISATGTKYDRGKRNLEKLTGRAEPEQKTGYAAFAPEVEVFLKEHLFADIFERDVLSFTDREIVTISALIALGGVEPMMQSHMTIGLNLGLSESGLRQIVSVIESEIGKKEADAGRNVLSRVIAAKKA